MADSITTTATLKAECLELDAETDRLLDAADFSGDSAAKLHKAAWSAVKRDLAERRPPVAEEDITDTTNLKYPTHLVSYHILYRLSEIEDDSDRSKGYWLKYRKKMRDIEPVTGTAQVATGSETFFARG